MVKLVIFGKYVNCMLLFGIVQYMMSTLSFLYCCAANGAELEGQSTNTLPGGSEGEGAAAPQPY